MCLIVGSHVDMSKMLSLILQPFTTQVRRQNKLSQWAMLNWVKVLAFHLAFASFAAGQPSCKNVAFRCCWQNYSVFLRVGSLEEICWWALMVLLMHAAHRLSATHTHTHGNTHSQLALFVLNWVACSFTLWTSCPHASGIYLSKLKGNNL